jgi:ankyrin repeat protein
VQDDVLMASQALHAAAAGGHVAVLEALLSLGASPHGIASRKNKHSPPILLATQHGHAGAVQLLLSAGANPNQNNQNLVNSVILAATVPENTPGL